MFVAMIYLLCLFFLITIALTLCIYLILSVYSTLKGSPFVPTKKSDLAEIFKLTKLKEGQRFIELGSGDGRVVNFISSTYRIKSLGIEVNPLLYAYSILNSKFTRATNSEFQKKDFFDIDLSPYNVIYFFLLPKTIQKLTKKFETECKKATIIISHGFPIHGFENFLYYKRDNKPFKTFFYKLA